jgi:hypothetical protein
MWPFKKKSAPAKQGDALQPMSFSQLDTTERFGDNRSLGAGDWIETAPLNATIRNPESMGLPPPGATEGETYRVADRLSRLRESVSIPDDGVYCPICHIASTQLDLLRTPCPRCGRELLKFGWD